MPKQLMIKDTIIQKLDAIKDDAEAKSYSDIIDRLIRVYREHEPGEVEIIQAFERLKQELTSIALDGSYVTMCDFLKIITLNLSRNDPEDRFKLINGIQKNLEEWITKSKPKEKPKLEAESNE